MIEIERNKNKKKNKINIVVLIIILFVSLIICTSLGDDNTPPIDANPVLSVLFGVITFTCLTLLIKPMSNLMFDDKGHVVKIDGEKVPEVRAFSSLNSAATVAGVKQEIQQRLVNKKFVQLNAISQAYCRLNKFILHTFQFAEINEILDITKLKEKVKNIVDEIENYNTKRIDCKNIILCFIADKVTDQNIKDLSKIASEIQFSVDETINLCIYDVLQKCAYANSSKIEVGIPTLTHDHLLENIVVGTKRIEIYGKVVNLNEEVEKLPRLSEKKYNEIAVNDMALLKPFNPVFLWCLVMGIICLTSFVILLVLTLTVHLFPLLKFWLLFVPTLLITGLLFFYVSITSHYKITIDHKAITVSKGRRYITMMQQPLEYIVNQLNIYVIYPAGNKVEKGNNYLLNTFSKYIRVKKCVYNKTVLEKYCSLKIK